ncbi:MAG: heat-inducible transcription repressor HrcA [Kofleriaceae bacterium]|nr:MAG: heat-inducible transcription repressor HrcA [Kofleriaceae bacterium]MBZ0238009.1 heat-inducible transcriptional repressor HrcA [Kofleriaceae bacterium]
MSTPELSRRARKILQAVVSEYLQSGDAVGSRTVTRRHDIGLSPATVRNVMSDLEEMGLLEQRHTSAGRVPTESGLRFFIQSLLKVRGLSPREKDEIRARLTGPTSEDVLQSASRLLSEITQHAAVIVAPDPAMARFGHVEFVPMRDGKLLAVLVTVDGRIENRIITSPSVIDAARLERIHNFLNMTLSGLTLDEVRARVQRELGDDKHRYDEMIATALRLGEQAFAPAPGEARSADVVISGQANLVDPEAAADKVRLDRMRELLRALEDRALLVQLLDRTKSAEGIQVFLGAETAHAALSESSVVAVPYGGDERPIGAIAVIGPMRMNYGKVMSIVDFTADLLGHMLREPE